MKALLTSLGVTLALSAGPCLAVDSFTPEGGPIYSVTAKGKDDAAAGGNARVAALRSALKEMAGDEFVRSHSKEVRNGIILRYQDFTGEPLNASSEKDGKLMRMKADVAVDAEKLAAALSAIGAEVVMPKPANTAYVAAAAGAGAENNATDIEALAAASRTGAGTPEGGDGAARPAADDSGDLAWLRSAGLTWQERGEGPDGAPVLKGVAYEDAKRKSKLFSESLAIRGAVPGASASDPVTVEYARFEGIRITFEDGGDMTEVHAPFLETRGCRLVPISTEGRVSYLPESSVAKGSPEFSMADIITEVRHKDRPDAKPAVITIKSVSGTASESGQTGSISGVSIDDGDGFTATLDELAWKDLLIPSAPELAALAADSAALDKAVDRGAAAAGNGGSIDMKGFRASYAGMDLKLGVISFSMSPAGAEGSSFRLALEGLDVPPSVFGMIPGIPADIVKAVLPEGETLGFSLEGTVVPGRTSKAPSTLRAVLSGANLCDLGAETAFLLDADSFAELSEGGGLMALLGAADRISLTKASVSLTDRRALGLMLAVGAGMMQSKPSQLLPQAASMMQAMKPESPQNGMDRLLAEVIGAVQPVLATLGGLSVSLEFPTPVKASAPTIPDDVMVTTSVKEASRPVLETLPENLR